MDLLAATNEGMTGTGVFSVWSSYETTDDRRYLDFNCVSEVASVPITTANQTGVIVCAACAVNFEKKKNIVKRCAIQCGGDPFHRQKKKDTKKDTSKSMSSTEARMQRCVRYRPCFLLA